MVAILSPCMLVATLSPVEIGLCDMVATLSPVRMNGVCLWLLCHKVYGGYSVTCMNEQCLSVATLSQGRGLNPLAFWWLFCHLVRMNKKQTERN